jgi:hypothetical protein
MYHDVQFAIAQELLTGCSFNGYNNIVKLIVNFVSKHTSQHP